MNRRKFIKGMLGTGLVTAGSCVFRVPLISSASATASGQPTVVVIFQRGGCDGLNTVVPYGDAEYYNLRPDIAVPGPNDGQAFPALALNDHFGVNNNFFGLHPSMSSLMSIYNNQKMAVLPTVHYPSPSRSHFDSQYFIESGVSSNNNDENLDGWLNRHLQLSGNLSPLQGIGFGSGLAQSLRGTIPVQSLSFINSFDFGLNATAEQNLINGVLPTYEESPSPQSSYRELVHKFGQSLFTNLDTIAAIDTDSYVPTNGAVYSTSSYGRRLKETAQLIKDPAIGLEVVCIDIGNYDTHSDQGAGEPEGRLSKRLTEFSEGVSALVTDLGSKMDDVIIVTMTEFGRTAKQNGSQGTDHGNAASWFVIGNTVQGGIYMRDGEQGGGWPGLTTEALYRDRYLASTIDYRDILGDILAGHLGHSGTDLDTLLPGHNYSTLNLLG